MLPDVHPLPLSGLDAIPGDWRGAVIAIGNFDGVHRGHQAVLGAARAEADHRGVPAIMVTLEPHPRSFFSGKTLFRLTPGPVKTLVAEGFGMDGALVLQFDQALADLTAEDFVSRILLERLGIAHAAVGYDFHFGKNREGTPGFLQRQGVLNGFGVTVVGEYDDAVGLAVSSTRVRAALTDGDLTTANDLLGWQFSVIGEVAGGARRGRDLGYPTANMEIEPGYDMEYGIYAVRYLRAGGELFDGVANFGRRPTFDNGRPLLETFLFDFSGDLYGEAGMVSFVSWLRPELRFDNIEWLVKQMDHDCIEARARLERTPPGDLDRRIHAAWARATAA